MAEKMEVDSIKELCSQFDKLLKNPLEVDKYIKALDQIFSTTLSGTPTTEREDIEAVVTRSYQDHSETREYLSRLIRGDIERSVDIFEQLSTRTVHVLVGSFGNAEESKPLVKEIYGRFHLGEDKNVHYLLSCILQLFNKFDYNFDDLRAIVRELCLRMREKDVRSMSLVIFSTLDKKFHDKFEAQFLNVIDGLILEAQSDIGNDPISIIVDTLTEVYPAFTTFCSNIMLGKDLDRLLQERALSKNVDTKFILDLLRLLSVACIDENIRVHISEHYVQILERSLTVKKYEVFSALVLIKTWSFTKLDQVSISSLGNILTTAFVRESDGLESDELSAAIEGLAYLSLKTSVKMLLRHHKFFCPRMVEMVKEQNLKDHNLYGMLIVLANLSTLPDSSNEPKSIRELQNYSNLKTGKEDNENNIKDDPNAVIKFNDEYIIESEIISILKSEITDLSQGCRDQLVRIIYNVTRNTSSIAQCIEQGATTAILEYLVNATAKENPVRILACRALTRILIHTNPSLIFKKYSPLNALPFLFALLPTLPKSPAEDDESFFNDDQITVADQFEGLLALTNLASAENSDGEDICKTIATSPKYWSIVENLMLDENPILRRATLELICNLMSHPVSIAVKFFNFENPQSLKNFNLLVKLLLLDDIKSQRAVAAIFANIANTIPFVSQELLKQHELIKNAITVLTEQMDDPDIRQRIIMLFYALFELAPESETKSNTDLQEVLKMKEMDQLKEALQTSATRADTAPEYADVVPLILAKFK